jgi:S1-C subfamily serine protease
MRITIAAVLAAAAAGAAAQGADPVPPELLFEKLAPSVWTIETFDARNKPLSLGSGVVIGRDQVVTNCHVLAKAKRAAVTRDDVSYGATLEWPDVERDLCILKVPNLDAPAVTVASAEGMKTGSRVYAIGSPRGLDRTISDGLLSGVRRSANGEFIALQVTVPISPGSSGGGLFDNRGRLIGITSFQLKEGQNLNFAVPATWIKDVPERAKVAMAQPSRGESSRGGSVVMEGAREFEYELRDRVTGNVRAVTYRLERVDGDKRIFNQGSHVEDQKGNVLVNSAAIGGDFDAAMPPGGWVPADTQPGAYWTTKYRTGSAGSPVNMDLEARAVGEDVLKVKGRDLRVLRVEFEGYTQRGSSPGVSPGGRYAATAWYAPTLQRIVRFEAKSRGGVTTSAFLVDEELRLVDIRGE